MKYELLKADPARAEAKRKAPAARPARKPVRKEKPTRPKKAAPAVELRILPKAEETRARAAPTLDLPGLVAEVKRALRLLKDGKVVAAHEALEAALERTSA